MLHNCTAAEPRSIVSTTTTGHGEDRAFKGKVTLFAIAAAVGGFLFGFDSSVINGAVDAIKGEFNLSDAASGFAVASALIGCAFGAYFAGRLADRYGRTRIMFWAAVLFFVSSIGSAFAFATWDLVIWRLVGGLGIGTASVIAPAYISEVSPKAIRGRLASFQQLAITLGIFAALLSDQLFAVTAGSASAEVWGLAAWRWMFLVGVIPSVVYGVLAITLPESPRYLLTKGRADDARVVMGKIVPRDTVNTSLEEIQDGIKKEANEKKGSIRGNRFGLQPIVWVGIILAVLQQFVGINVIFYYSTTLWQAVGFKEEDSFLISTITSVVNVAVTFVAIFLVDKVGRKPLLVAGSAGMFVSLTMVAIAFSQATIVDGSPSLPGSWGVIALIFANLFVVSFGATWGPLMWVLLGEMFPNRIRATALGIGSAANWIANFIVTISFPVLSGFNLTVTYGIYALFALLSLFFVIAKIPETKGRSLEEMGISADGDTVDAKA
ncbi:sugar porter family MFS transporter [Curtobacterium flaccumfaciens pv. flaccumfaciens]|nr:MFS transporter [Curtobacterium sp. MCLR17_044]PZE98058.1 MFS transporter [Curtobacterium sp. MCLR17_040]PZF10155.1 MFS transporter [Curtobacterium sp. MCLR17_034]QYI97454.1 sugar porter family MFS transporter [Curtobacterium flaccumfaciens pv. flaccumfaciens]